MIEIKTSDNKWYIYDHATSGYLHLDGTWHKKNCSNGWYATKWLAEAALEAASVKPAESNPAKAADRFCIGKGFGGWYVCNRGSQYLHTNGQLLGWNPLGTVFYPSKASAEGALFNYLNPPSSSKDEDNRIIINNLKKDLEASHEVVRTLQIQSDDWQRRFNKVNVDLTNSEAALAKQLNVPPAVQLEVQFDLLKARYDQLHVWWVKQSQLYNDLSIRCGNIEIELTNANAARNDLRNALTAKTNKLIEINRILSNK